MVAFKINNMCRILIRFLFCIMIFSCGDNRSESEPKENEFSAKKLNKATRFKKYISKFKLLKFPFEVNTDCYSPEESDYCKFDKINDSQFIFEPEINIAIGLLPDTSNFYAVIYATPTVCYLPILAIYSKKGKLIDKESIGNGCGSDCGYTCSDKLIINSLSNITIKNVIEMYECDSLGEETPGSWKKMIEIKKCSVDNYGKIKSKVTSTKETKE